MGQHRPGADEQLPEAQQQAPCLAKQGALATKAIQNPRQEAVKEEDHAVGFHRLGFEQGVRPRPHHLWR
eukprot:7845383-Alexandrium_andersonii.AAC.1